MRHITMTHDRRKVLDDVSLDVNRGDFLAITGPNGGGKTTLLRIMLKLLRPDRGTVEYCDCADKPLRIGYLPQKNMIDSQFPITVSEVIGSGLLGLIGLAPSQRQERIAATLAAVDMEAHSRQPIGTLSGGQLQRTLLGRAIIAEPALLILDEPLSYIDKRFEGRFYDLIHKLKQTTTIVLVSHEMTRISGMATRHLIVNGNIHECTAQHHYINSECE